MAAALFIGSLPLVGPAAAQRANPCGAAPGDWCASPPGDACGRHPDEGSCRSDPACVGMPYRGESVIACLPDGRGFWSNCPAVGCVSRPAGGPSGR